LLDTVDVYCRQILPEILDVLPESRGLLATFDCDLTAESYQASVYEIYLYQLYQLMKPLNPEKMCVVGWHQMPQGIYNYIHFAFRGDESKRKIMKEAWSKVKPYLISRFNTDDTTKWRWGELHLDHSRHMVFRGNPILSNFFNLKTLGRGNTHTCNMYRADLVEWGNFETTLRAGLRAIYGYGQGFQDLFVIDHGISENILSGINSVIKVIIQISGSF
jgi:acyl-homoserine lactone acylase PvdQ